MKEIFKKLWVAVDYMGGNNIDGARSAGIAWRFGSNISLLFGYNNYHRASRSGEDTLTTQLDINFP